MSSKDNIKVIKDKSKPNDRRDLEREEKSRFEDDGGGQHQEPTPGSTKPARNH
jgi:hypothetical protein